MIYREWNQSRQEICQDLICLLNWGWILGCLILEKERYRFQKVLSDISGSDIRAHNSDPETLVRNVRNWIFDNVRQGIRSGTKIWQRYNKFLSSFESSVKDEGFTKKDIDEMPVAEFIYFIKSWIDGNP